MGLNKELAQVPALGETYLLDLAQRLNSLSSGLKAFSSHLFVSI